MRAANPDRLRILLVHHAGDPAGGVETHVACLAGLLERRGHEVRRSTKFPLSDSKLGDFTPDVVHVHHGALDLASPAIDSTAAPPLVRTLHDLRVVCPGANRLDRRGRVCERRASLACVAQGVAGHCSGLSRWPLATTSAVRRWVHERDRLRTSDALLVASGFMRDLLLREEFAPQSVHLLPYPVSIPEAEPPPPSRAQEIVFAGRLVAPDKGLDLLLEAIARTPRELHFAIAGAGPADRWLDARLAQSGLVSRVRRLGALDHEATLELLGASAMVVLPSRWPEPSGLVGLEAAALGRPVVGFDVGGVGEWLRDGESGFLVRVGDADALAERMVRLHADPVARDRMGRAGRQWVRAHHGIEAFWLALEARYRAAMGQGAT